MKEAAKKSPTQPNYDRCSKEEARRLVDTFPSHAKRSVAYHALNVIIEALGEDNTASLADVLAELFLAVDIDKARRRLTTEIANRVYKDDAGNAPLKIVCTRKGDEPAQIWLESIVVTDTRGLMDAGERYAPENFVASDAVRATSEEIKREIANPPPAPSLSDVHSNEEESSDESAVEEDERIEARNARRDDSPKSDSYRQAQTRAIENATKPNSGVNDSLRGIDTTNFTATDALRADGFHAFAEAPIADNNNTVNALDAMLTWASDASPNTPKLLALLGDYGTGKTSHALQFSRVLNGDVTHEKRPTQPLSALHIDLAYLRGAPGLAQLNVTQLIGLVIDARGLGEVLSPNVVVREVREGRRIVVYDGLDELMQTDHAQLHSVFRQLLQIFEPDPVTRAPSRARAIVSCRTHYFRDLAEQHEFFNSRMRGSVSGKDYLCLYLLPWETSTVREYLNKRLSAEEAKALDETIRTTYNLEELASRPVLLAMMCEQVGEVLRLRDANGGSITASTLYAQTVAMWVRRDDEKHILQATHKPILMGALACAMWNDGKESWDTERLDSWLRKAVDQLFPNHYSPEQTRAIQDDLRTATFIVRPNSDSFTFAHRSFMEFFLARHVISVLDNEGFSRRDTSAMLPRRNLNREVTKFLSELFKKDELRFEGRMKSLWRLLSDEVASDSLIVPMDERAPDCNEALFRLAISIQLDPSFADAPVNLRGLTIRDLRLERIQLPSIDFRGGTLWNVYARECKFGRVIWDGIQTSCCSFIRCSFDADSAPANQREGCFVRAISAEKPKHPVAGKWSRPRDGSKRYAGLDSVTEKKTKKSVGIRIRLGGSFAPNCYKAVRSASGRLAVTVDTGGQVRCWCVASGELKWSNKQLGFGLVSKVNFCDAESKILFRGADGFWGLVDTAAGSIVDFYGMIAHHIIRNMSALAAMEAFSARHFAREFGYIVPARDLGRRGVFQNIDCVEDASGVPQPKVQLDGKSPDSLELAIEKNAALVPCEIDGKRGTRYLVHGSNSESSACFDTEGNLLDYDEEAADTWLRYLGNGYSQPVEAAWLELDEFGRVLGPKKEAAS